MSYLFIYFHTNHPEAKNAILDFLPQIKRVVPHEYHKQTTITLESGLLTYWSRFETDTLKYNPGLITESSGAHLFCSGYAQEGILALDAENAGIFKLINYKDGHLKLINSPGGVGSYIYIPKEKDTAVAWSTQPASAMLFVAKNRANFTVIGNSPLMVHCASFLSTAIRYNKKYLSKYLCAGFAVDGDTPFINTLSCPPNACISLKSNSFKFESYPLLPPEQIPQNLPLKEKSNLLAGELVNACYPAKVFNKAAISLSGGKDSRTICAALSAIGVKDIVGFTYGSDTGGEAIIGKLVAKQMGIHFNTLPMRLISDPLEAITYGILKSQGLGIAFPHQFNLKYDLSHCNNYPVFLGKGHLLRGGAATTMKKDAQFLEEAFFNEFISDFVTSTCSSDTIDFLVAWRDERKRYFRDGRDVLFYTHHDFRAALFNVPATLDLTSQALMVQPLLDEKISRFARSLSVFDRVSERVVFGAIRQLADGLSRIPLYGDIWRFDRSPEQRSFPDSDHNFQDGWQERQPIDISKNLFASSYIKEKTLIKCYDHNSILKNNVGNADLSDDVDKKIAGLILNSQMFDSIYKLIQPCVISEIESRQKGFRSEVPSIFRLTKGSIHATSFSFDC